MDGLPLPMGDLPLPMGGLPLPMGGPPLPMGGLPLPMGAAAATMDNGHHQALHFSARERLRERKAEAMQRWNRGGSMVCFVGVNIMSGDFLVV